MAKLPRKYNIPLKRVSLKDIPCEDRDVGTGKQSLSSYGHQTYMQLSVTKLIQIKGNFLMSVIATKCINLLMKLLLLDISGHISGIIIVKALDIIPMWRMLLWKVIKCPQPSNYNTLCIKYNIPYIPYVLHSSRLEIESCSLIIDSCTD